MIRAAAAGGFVSLSQVSFRVRILRVSPPGAGTDAMLTLTFKAPKLLWHSIGPVPALRFIRNTLHVEGQDSAIATLDRKSWLYRGRRYLRLECKAVVQVHFVDDANGRRASI